MCISLAIIVYQLFAHTLHFILVFLCVSYIIVGIKLFSAGISTTLIHIMKFSLKTITTGDNL